MAGQLVRFGESRHLCHVVEAEHLTTGGIFNHQQTGAGKMRIVRFDCGLNVGSEQTTVWLVGQWLWLDRPQHRHATGFPFIGVPVLPDDGFVTTLTMAHQRDQIGHGTTRCKQRCVKTK